MQGRYDIYIVLLSVLVAMVSSYVALDLAGRISSAGRMASRVWLFFGALSMGLGIWSMHFIGMLAFSLPIKIAYDPSITIASLVIAVVTSGFALAVVSHLAVINQSKLDAPILAAGGVVMGAGICGMHYTGMAAMNMVPPIRYSPTLFASSMVIAVTAAIAALWLSFILRSEASLIRRITLRILAAAVMGLAIAGMHYTGMAAAQFDATAICATSSASTLSNAELSYAISISVLGILAMTIWASWVEARRTIRGKH